VKRLAWWQWVALSLPLLAIASLLLLAAGQQLQAWGLSWIWAVFILVLAGWRWLLARWTRPAAELNQAIAALREDLATETVAGGDRAASRGASRSAAGEAVLQQVLAAAQNDPPPWEAPQTFWQRCQELLTGIAKLYYPEAKYPLLAIYIPEAYTLLRGTIDDLDRWMQQLAPVLNQVTIGQAYQAWEVYQTLEPSARRLWQLWNWAQWLINPAAAAARLLSQSTNEQATQQLVVNASQLLRAALLRNLGEQAIALYGRKVASLAPPPELATGKSQTLQAILAQAEPEAAIAQQPANLLLVGRTGAGKSSTINTLFQAECATVDVLPSTDEIQRYVWSGEQGEVLHLWDTPGYEQVQRSELRAEILDFARQADLALLVLPALDPALQMDADFLTALREAVPELPAIAIVTQVDRLRPLREWQPPYDWQAGDRPKEQAIRAAVQYRLEALGAWCDPVLPLVTDDAASGRPSWNVPQLSAALLAAVSPAKQLRLARLLRDREARAIAAAQLIDRYTFQMATQQGLAAFLKSPVLQWIATLSTGSPELARVLATKIPVEQLPAVIGKLQLAYDLHGVINADNNTSFDLLALWPLLLDNPAAPDRNAWAFGHALVEYWTQGLSTAQVRSRFYAYLDQVPA